MSTAKTDNTENWVTVGLIEGFQEDTMKLVSMILRRQGIEEVMYGSVKYCVKVAPENVSRARSILSEAKELEAHWFRVTDESGNPWI